MAPDPTVENRPPRKKPLWPWLLLLILTLLAIYSWNRATELFDELSRTMPAEIIELFKDLLNEHSRDERVGPRLDVVLPTSTLLR